MADRGIGILPCREASPTIGYRNHCWAGRGTGRLLDPFTGV